MLTIRLIPLMILVGSCSPRPESVPCSNGGDCEAADPRFAFCSQGQCVECVGRGSCDGNPCVDGRCSIPCSDGRDCASDRKCVSGQCVYPDWQ